DRALSLSPQRFPSSLNPFICCEFLPILPVPLHLQYVEILIDVSSQFTHPSLQRIVSPLPSP
ncbi:MAG: hypothetical protein AAB279_07570, partial [Candidatus Binatota bacterium]